MSQATLSFESSYLNKLDTNSEKLIAQFTLLRANGEKLIWWSKKKIAAYLQCSIRSVYSAYRKMTNLGLIRDTGIRKGYKKRTPVYEVMDPKQTNCTIGNTAKYDTINDKELYIEKKEEGEQKAKQDQNTTKASPPPKPPKQKKPWSSENEKIFSERFKGREVSIEDVFEKCARYKADRNGNVSDADFKKWILETDVMKFRIKAQEVRSTIKEFPPVRPYTQEDRQRAADGRGTWMSIMRKKLGI